MTTRAARWLPMAAIGVAMLTPRGALAAHAAQPREVEPDDPFQPVFPPLPFPTWRDDRASVVFMDRALSFYAAEERYRTLTQARVLLAVGGLEAVVGTLVVARADTTRERTVGWITVGVGGLMLGGGIAGHWTRSDLEELRDNYVTWRSQDQTPTWLAVQRAHDEWRAIARKQRSLRRLGSRVGVGAGTALGTLAILGAAAGDAGQRGTATVLALNAFLFLGTSVRLLSTETPAEAGYRGWQVYVQPLPPLEGAANPGVLAAEGMLVLGHAL